MANNFIGKKKAICLVLLTMVFTLFTYIYVATELEHDCVGEDCPICEMVLQCQQTLQQLGVGVIPLVTGMAFFFQEMRSTISELREKRSSTLVSAKVRMDC